MKYRYCDLVDVDVTRIRYWYY